MKCQFLYGRINIGLVLDLPLGYVNRGNRYFDNQGGGGRVAQNNNNRGNSMGNNNHPGQQSGSWRQGGMQNRRKCQVVIEKCIVN